MSVYFPYCEKCLKQPTAETKEFYDYRLEKPTCLNCAVEFGLVAVCPNGEGDAFACESFCPLCEGSGEIVAGG